MRGDRVKVYPVPGRYIIGEPAIEREVSAAEAKRLLKYGAFTTDPPAKPAKPTGPPDGGPSDSTEE